MGRWWGILLWAAAAGGDDDLRQRLASRAAAIRAARGEKGAEAPPPPVVLRAPRVDHSDVGNGDAVAGAAGVTVPVAIDGADARLRAEPGEALIVAAVAHIGGRRPGRNYRRDGPAPPQTTRST